MILTVTPNSALDRVIVIDSFQPTHTMHAKKVINSVGGKGLDASVALRTLGAETTAVSFVAGITGQQLKGLLDDYTIQHDFIWVGGETRTAHVLVETKENRHSHVMTGRLEISSEDWQEFLRRIQTHLPAAAWLVSGGSLPASIPTSCYHTLTELAHEANVPVLIDASGDAMRLALSARPTVIKMNRAEYEETFGVKLLSIADIKTHAIHVSTQFKIQNLVVTWGKEGIFGFNAEGAYLAAAPPQQQINAAGAGDAASAALAWRLSLNDTWPDALRWAAAAGAAVVLTEGTADFRMDDLSKILEQVNVRKI
jgi:1-phosphofructokinase family hexose kinase